MDETETDEVDVEDAELQEKYKVVNKQSGRLKKIIVLIVIFIIIISLVSHFIMVYLAASALELKDEKISAFKVKSFDQYEVTFTLTLNNPTDTEIQITDITYNIYVEDQYLGKGNKGSFSIMPRSKDYQFNFGFELEDLQGQARNLFLTSTATLTITGEVTTPVLLFGIIKLGEITIDYEIEKEISAI